MAALYSYELKTSSPTWPIRRGLVLHHKGGWGEIAPLPGFSQETLEEAYAEITSLLPDLENAKPKLPSVQFGIESALRPFLQTPLKIPISLLNEPRPGFSTLKLKLGHLPLEEAIAKTKTLMKTYRLRLDCNRAWTLEQALAFARHFSPNDFDYLEEPVKTIPELIRFSTLTGFPIALHESNVPPSAIPTLKALVIKPTLVGALPPSPVPIVLSSAYESSLGLLLIARAYKNGAPPVGLDTFRSFHQDLLVPKLRAEGGFLIWEPSTESPVDKKLLCAI